MNSPPPHSTHIFASPLNSLPAATPAVCAPLRLQRWRPRAHLSFPPCCCVPALVTFGVPGSHSLGESGVARRSEPTFWLASLWASRRGFRAEAQRGTALLCPSPPPPTGWVFFGSVRLGRLCFHGKTVKGASGQGHSGGEPRAVRAPSPASEAAPARFPFCTPRRPRELVGERVFFLPETWRFLDRGWVGKRKDRPGLWRGEGREGGDARGRQAGRQGRRKEGVIFVHIRMGFHEKSRAFLSWGWTAEERRGQDLLEEAGRSSAGEAEKIIPTLQKHVQG